MSIQPLVRNNISTLSKCGAKTRKGTLCLQPAMKNGRCRLHGGKSTGPKTPEGKARAGNWKHGFYSKLAKEERRLMRQLIKESRETINIITK